MTGYALLNVLLFYHLGHGTALLSWLLGATAVAQLFWFWLLHDSPRELVVADLAVAAGCLILHEVWTRAAATRATVASATAILDARRPLRA